MEGHSIWGVRAALVATQWFLAVHLRSILATWSESSPAHMQALPLDRSIAEVLTKVFNRSACKVLRVVEAIETDEQTGEPALLASVTVRVLGTSLSAVLIKTG
jgi:hypothetical protein